MALTLDATVGGASSNSYISRSDADDYLAEIYPAWSEQTDALKDRLLIEATWRIDAMALNDERYSEDQALHYPTEFCLDDDTTLIPDDIAYAVAELAVSMISTAAEGYDELRNAGISSIQEGELSISFSGGAGGAVSSLGDLVNSSPRSYSWLTKRSKYNDYKGYLATSGSWRA